jgi:type II secretory ATPase GspE/PulE/Tfp pilus assembly ATPase PilB-like protein
MMHRFQPQPEAQRLLSRPLVVKWGIFPVAVNKELLSLLTAAPLSANAAAEITFITGKFLDEEVIPERQLLSLIDEYFPPATPSVETIHRDGEGYQHAGDFEISVKEDSGGSSVISLVDAIINQAISMSASDIHFEPTADLLEVRFRVDGLLQPMHPVAKEEQSAVMSRVKLMAKMDIAEKRKPQDGRITMEKPDATIDIRVSSIPASFGEKIVLRILDKSVQKRKLADLGMYPDDLTRLLRYLEKPQGMILVTGPTGSGKTTTLYGALSHLLRPQVNIMTIEDPIEYEIPGITQSQVKPEIHYDFATALRAMLRQDPDVIMVGEIRDRETAQIALRAAMTGHLVLSTVHTNNAIATIARLVDLGVEPYLVSSSLSLVVAQRLVRRLCTACRMPHPSPESIIQALSPNYPTSDTTIYSRGAGCHHCGLTGYKGRVGVFELMENSEPIQQAIHKGQSEEMIKKLHSESGSSTLRESSARLVLSGSTTFEELLRVVE